MLSLGKTMARATGLEPATSGVTGRHSNRLSYARARRRVFRGGGGGLRPPETPVKRPDAKPRGFFEKAEKDRIFSNLVGGEGLEPPTLSV